MKNICEYDIGLVYRSNHNYGANMTHFALYSILTQWGYRVAMIDLPEDSALYLPVARYNPYELYINIPYDENSIRYRFKHKWELMHMNQKCKLFIVGSDQLWRNYFVKGTDYYSTLDWVLTDKFKMSYGTSFGVAEFEGDKEDEQALVQRLKRFNAISVREQSGIEIINKIVHKDAVCVADPVFLCPREKFYSLAEHGKERLPKGKYIAAYILDRTDKKDNLIKKIGRVLEYNNSVLIEDAMVEHEYQLNDELNPIQDAKNEEWLAMIQNCEMLITDSFHGTCFAIIFGKQFYTISSPDSHRGYSRIENLLMRLNLRDRIICDLEGADDIVLEEKEINYKEVYCKIKEYVYQSEVWLKDNLLKGMQYHPIAEELKEEDSAINDLLIAEYSYNKKILEVLDMMNLKSGDDVVVWGTGNCFCNNIKFINDIFKVDKIVDSNTNKWGKKYLNDIECISPQELIDSEVYIPIIVLVEKTETVEEIREYLQWNNRTNFFTYKELFLTS